MAEPSPALSRDLQPHSILALKDMELAVWSRVLCYPNTFFSTQAYSFIIRYLYLWLRFPCLL